MDEAQRFVRDALSYTGIAPVPWRTQSERVTALTIRQQVAGLYTAFRRLWRGRDSGETYAPVPVPLKPRDSGRQAGAVLPLP